MSVKHIPERTCIGCRIKKPKAGLLRFTYHQPKLVNSIPKASGQTPNPKKSSPKEQRFESPDNKIAYDPGKKLPGRGVYLCADEACLHLAIKRRGLDSAYRTKIPKVNYQHLAGLFLEIIKYEK